MFLLYPLVKNVSRFICDGKKKSQGHRFPFFEPPSAAKPLSQHNVHLLHILLCFFTWATRLWTIIWRSVSIDLKVKLTLFKLLDL